MPAPRSTPAREPQQRLAACDHLTGERLPDYLQYAWPRAIAHVDGDAFFASCEQALNPSFKGKPVVTGKERNIVAAASYEAKARGVSRGVALWDAKKLCPELIVLPSDYETYSLFSKRMFTIMRRFSPMVEESSVDEGFVDLTGFRRVHHASYEVIARRMQQAIHQELGITVSVGVSITKTIAKAASKHRKPAGLTMVSGRQREAFLAQLPIEDVWNIGPNTAALLQGYGFSTALTFARAPEPLLAHILSKPGMAVWDELNGRLVSPVTTEEKASYQTISKTKTFTPPSDDRAFVFAQLMKNLENACLKARRHRLATKKLVVYLRQWDFHGRGAEVTLSRATAFPIDLGPAAQKLFAEIYQPGTRYRATGVILADLQSSASAQLTLFEDAVRVDKAERVYAALDALREKYGKHVVHQGASLLAQKTQHLTARGLALRMRGDVPARRLKLLKGETRRRRLPIPLVQVKLG